MRVPDPSSQNEFCVCDGNAALRLKAAQVMRRTHQNGHNHHCFNNNSGSSGNNSNNNNIQTTHPKNAARLYHTQVTTASGRSSSKHKKTPCEASRQTHAQRVFRSTTRGEQYSVLHCAAFTNRRALRVRSFRLCCPH